MTRTRADRIWNRAALERGGYSPLSGNRALASLLLLHGLVMNGGVHHAIASVGPENLVAATHGHAFFGLDDVAAFLRGMANDRVPSRWTANAEEVANRRYAEMVPDDSYLETRFQDVLREHPERFAPIDGA
jgi:hypothetical protein